MSPTARAVDGLQDTARADIPLSVLPAQIAELAVALSTFSPAAASTA
ncbi:hypothetical protein [Microlunatus soli]|nr:hypothetical protein [Microlunatus soli]